MTIIELGALGVLAALIFLAVEMRRNNKLQLRANAKQAARDDVISLQNVIQEDVERLLANSPDEAGFAGPRPQTPFETDSN